MNKQKFLLLFTLFGVISSSFGQSKEFLDILGQIESSNNPLAYNKKENAVGIYQIREAYFKDAQEFNSELKKYKHSDCYKISVSKKVVTSYLSRYCKEKTWENMARCHNSGPNWKNKKQLTEKYWNKFQEKCKIVMN